MIANHQGLQSLGRVLTVSMGCCLFNSLLAAESAGDRPLRALPGRRVG